MRKVWSIVALVIIAAVVMIALTYINPDIKTYASNIAGNKHLPLWLVGLFAPIAYLFQRITGWIKSFSLNSGVTMENKKIKAEQEQIRRDIDSLIQWRSTMLNREYEAVRQLKKEITEAELKLAQITSKIQQLRNTPVEAIAASMTNEEATDTLLDFFNRNKATVYTD